MRAALSTSHVSLPVHVSLDSMCHFCSSRANWSALTPNRVAQHPDGSDLKLSLRPLLPLPAPFISRPMFNDTARRSGRPTPLRDRSLADRSLVMAGFEASSTGNVSEGDRRTSGTNEHPFARRRPPVAARAAPFRLNGNRHVRSPSRRSSPTDFGGPLEVLESSGHRSA